MGLTLLKAVYFSAYEAHQQLSDQDGEENSGNIVDQRVFIPHSIAIWRYLGAWSTWLDPSLRLNILSGLNQNKAVTLEGDIV